MDLIRARLQLLSDNRKANTKPQINREALKFRKSLILQSSDMDLLYSMKIDPMIMRNAIKKFLKTRPIAFTTLRSYWLSHAGYICSHIRGLTREEDKNQYVPTITGKRKLYDFLKRCKNLESLRVYAEKVSPTMLRNIRYLQQLKCLHLVLDDYQMGENPNMVRDLRNLRYIYIKLGKSYENSSVASFCKHLMKLKSLEKIELDLQELSHPDHGSVLESVLQHMSKSNIDFTIRLCSIRNMLNIDNISCILVKIDTLILQCQNYSENELETNNTLESERSRITQQGHRVLHFIIQTLDEWNFVPIIQPCSSLQALWIEAERYRDLMLKQFSFPKTLKNLFLVLPYLPISEAKRSLSCLISALNYVESLETLLLAMPLQESLDQIEKLKDLRCISNSTKYHLTVCYVPNSFSRRTDENLLNSLCSPPACMSSLKSLKLDFEHSLVAPIKCLQRALDSLPIKLEQFELVISTYDGPDTTFDLYFPFEALSQLAEFRLDLYFPLSTDAGNRFAKEFVKMKGLQVMVVKGACFWNSNFKGQKIVEGLKQMTKIRDLQVSIGRNESFSLKDYQMMQKGEPDLTNCQIRRFRNW